MKKYICFIILDLSLSIVPAHATTAWTSSECNTEKGGEIVEVGGDSFCKSTSTMNWWSAYSWCQAMGGRMPSIAELCPGKEIVDRNPCGRSYSYRAWTQNPHNQETWNVTDNFIRTGNHSYRDQKMLVYCLKN